MKYEQLVHITSQQQKLTCKFWQSPYRRTVHGTGLIQRHSSAKMFHRTSYFQPFLYPISNSDGIQTQRITKLQTYDGA